MIDDIYKILRHHDKASKLLKQIEDNKIALTSIIARAADEIEELRCENARLKAELNLYE
jgi:hypothetical protein